jgi:hypothetical protein
MMMTSLLLLYLLPPLVSSECGVYLQSSNIRYLSPSQLARFNISDQCTTTCSDGYYGDFCQDLSQYTRLPMGPWNQAGYCTAGPGILRSMTIDVSAFASVQYTKKDSVLIGISNAGRTTNEGSMASVVSEISLYSRTITPVLRPTLAGSLNALLVRQGVVYVARTVKVSGEDTNDIAVLAAPMQARALMPVPVRVVMFDVCADKGTVTAFVYGASSLRACYPSGVCDTWVASIATVSGMMVGADCQRTLYVSSLASVLRVTSAGSALLRSAESTVYCLTGIPGVNALLYKSRNSMWQINLGTGSVQGLPLGVAQTQEVQCSADVSEQSNQILLVQNGVVSTLEAVQEPCAFGRTSQALLCNSTSQCTACPPPPANAYNTEGSVTCEWVCRAGFERMGAKCVAPVPLPCPSHHTRSPSALGLCVPSVLPWADPGKFAASAAYSPQLLLPAANRPVYMLASDGQALIHAVPGQFYLSLDGGASWTALSFASYTAADCYYSGQNSYYYLSSSKGVVWTAFTQQRSGGLGNCLWRVSATDAIASRGVQSLSVTGAWTLDRQLCSATGEGGAAHAVLIILCGDNYVSSLRSNALSPLIGSPLPGFEDGLFQAAKFSSPSSVVMFDSRLYVADTGNCAIREADLALGVVFTVAGAAGTCLQSDGVGSGSTLARPAMLSHTAYDGFFLFVDGPSSWQHVRQFHAPSSTVSTVRASPFAFSQISGLAASQHGVAVASQRAYHIYSASQQPCPPGTTSLAGNAWGRSDCVACAASHYSGAGGCAPCSTPACSLPGQLLVPCQPNADAYCGACTNKPAGNSRYVGASSIPGTALGGGDCAWVYTAPCPVGYYNGTGDACAICPPWSTTASSGSRLLSDCACTGGGSWVGGACVLPSPFASSPAPCSPLVQCAAYVEPASAFPVLPGCTSFDVDSRAGICPCQAGEYIERIHPKACTACPAGLYSPGGRGCRVCPYMTEPSLDRTSCRCAAGTRDVALDRADPQCVCGPGRAFNPSAGCTPCPDNTYSAAVRGYGVPMQALQCARCPAGEWAQPGATACAQCPFGKYRELETPGAGCRSCGAGSYAPSPAVALCVDCVPSCGGRRETPCGGELYMCSDCPPPRANAAFNGQRDCATSCNPGHYEADGECVRCGEYNRAACPPGNRFVGCGSYADAGCVACVNASMPLNFAVWAYRADAPDGPSLACEWACEAGYSPKRPGLPGWVDAEWECVKEGEWSVWDLFTL